MGLAWTKREGLGAQEALRNLLENLGFTNIAVTWPGHNDFTLWGEPEELHYRAEFVMTREQRHPSDIILYDPKFPELHRQIVECHATGNRKFTKWVNFGAGKEWFYQFRILDIDRVCSPPFGSGVIQAYIAARKIEHPKEDIPSLSREPKWI